MASRDAASDPDSSADFTLLELPLGPPVERLEYIYFGKSALPPQKNVSGHLAGAPSWVSRFYGLLPHSFQAWFFSKTSRFFRGSVGFLERRIPGKNGGGTPRTLIELPCKNAAV